MHIALATVLLGLVAGSLACSGSTITGGDGGDSGRTSAEGGGTCPATRPTQGAACASEGLSCQVGKNTTGCDSDSAYCQDGKWSVIGTPGCAAPHDSGTD